MSTLTLNAATVMAIFTRFFDPPSAEVLAKRELDNNKRQLLEAQRDKAWSTKRCEFYEGRIRELNAMLARQNTRE